MAGDSSSIIILYIIQYVYAAEVSANQLKSTHCTVLSDGIHDIQSMNYMYSLQQNIKQRERESERDNTEQSE